MAQPFLKKDDDRDDEGGCSDIYKILIYRLLLNYFSFCFFFISIDSISVSIHTSVYHFSTFGVRSTFPSIYGTIDFNRKLNYKMSMSFSVDPLAYDFGIT